MIYWTKKKKDIKKNSFQEISKDFIKIDFWINDFNFFIYKKKNQFIFSISFVFNFQKYYYKISIWAQKLFLLAFTIK